MVDRSFNIRFSPGGDVIIARDMTQVHFISIDGKSYWSNNRINKGFSIGYANGLAVLVVGSHSYLVFQLFDNAGKMIKEVDCQIGPELGNANVWDDEVYVNNNFQMARFTATDMNANRDRFITGFCIREKDKYNIFVVDGLWYYLENDGGAGTLVGYDNDKKEIVGYSVVLR